MANFSYPPENITGITGLVDYANSMTEGFLGITILIVIAVVSFIAAKTTGEKAWGFSAFLTLLSAIMLRYMHIINNAILFIVIFMFVAVSVWIWRMREEETV